MKFITLKFHYLVTQDFIMNFIIFDSKAIKLFDMLIKEKKIPSLGIVILQTSVIR